MSKYVEELGAQLRRGEHPRQQNPEQRERERQRKRRQRRLERGEIALNTFYGYYAARGFRVPDRLKNWVDREQDKHFNAPGKPRHGMRRNPYLSPTGFLNQDGIRAIYRARGPAPTVHHAGRIGGLPPQRYRKPRPIEPRLLPRGLHSRRPCPPLEVDELREILSVLSSRRQWCSSTLLAAILTALAGTGWPARKVLGMGDCALRWLSVPESFWNCLLAWERRRQKAGREGCYWLFCNRFKRPVSMSDLQNRLARAGRLIGRRISAKALRRTHQAVLEGRFGERITLKEYRRRHPTAREKFPVPKPAADDAAA